MGISGKIGRAGASGKSGGAGASDAGWPERLARISPQNFDIRIAADGTWYHQGAPITRMALVRLFSTVLMRHSDLSYWLVTPVERGRIEVEDVPFIVVSMSVEHGAPTSSGGTADTRIIRFRTNVDDEIALCADNALVMRQSAYAAGDLRPYVMVRKGLEARIARPVYYELAALCERGPDGRGGVWSMGEFFALEE